MDAQPDPAGHEGQSSPRVIGRRTAAAMELARRTAFFSSVLFIGLVLTAVRWQMTTTPTSASPPTSVGT